MLNPDALFLTRVAAGLSRDDLAARTAAIGHCSPLSDEFLREDLEVYIELAEEGRLIGNDTLPANHPYVRMLATALGTTPLRLIDEPTHDPICSG